MALINPQNNYLLSPPALQVGPLNVGIGLPEESMLVV